MYKLYGLMEEKITIAEVSWTFISSSHRLPAWERRRARTTRKNRRLR